jgi:hypothetical protein
MQTVTTCATWLMFTFSTVMESITAVCQAVVVVVALGVYSHTNCTGTKLQP